jgi:hypothetical protein
MTEEMAAAKRRLADSRAMLDRTEALMKATVVPNDDDAPREPGARKIIVEEE